MAPPSPRSARGKPAEARMEGGGKLCWNIEPYNGKNCFFTRESYEKYSLGPTLTELWQLSARTTVAPVETPSAPQTGEKASPPLPASKVPEVIPATRDALPHPAPRVPYPYFSSLSEMEQITYVNLMIKYLNKKRNFKPSATDLKEYEQYLSLKSKASNESKEFHKFLQNGARSCAEDYNWLSTDAQLYTEEVLKACRTYVTNYPEHYTVHEITSITGGKFITDLTLKLEKSLLKLGTVQFARIAFPTSALLLPADFQMVAELMPPASKAAILHTAVSSDPNAAKLATKYRPQVVLTAQALYALLNNHAGGYKEQWEIPVRVQTVCAAGADPTKVIYLDSPLPRKQQSVREKNQMFHEVPLDLFMAKKSGVPLNIIRLGSAEAEQTLPRKVEPSDDPEIDSEYDLTHLETFGSSENPAKVSKSEGSRKSMLDGATIEKRVIGTTNSDKRDAKEVETSRPTPGCSKMGPPTRAARLLWSDTDDTSSFEGFESDEIKDSDVGKESSEDGTRTASDNENKTESLPKGARAMSAKRPHTAPHYESDSDEDRLVIDVECKSHKPCSDAVAPLPGALPSPTRAREPSSCRARRAPGQPPKKISREFDPVGAILKMQAQLLKPGAKKVQEQSVASPERTGHASQILTSPPFKPSPSPDPAQGVPREVESSVPPHTRAKQSLLPSELLSCTEDATEYVAPQDGNSAYRLFSLGDLLLLIRSSVQKAHSKVRAQKTGTRQHLPVYILPKVDYQACYGAESLTDSESCRLWTESLLHSKCSYYIGHIDAFTSKLFMLEEMTSEGLKERIHHFKPANSLNILRHILKWVTGLQEGSYLLSHVSGDSSVYLYKSFSGKNTRGAYNLHSAHRGPPGVPSTLSVPWVPLDPSLLLPYHIHHGRPPCTFPPRPHENPAPAKVSACRANPRQTPGHANPPTTDAPFQSPTGKGAAKRKKKNKGKKALKWKAKFQCKNQAAAQT